MGLDYQTIDELKGFAGLSHIETQSIYDTVEAISNIAESDVRGEAWLELSNSTNKLDNLVVLQITNDYISTEAEKYADDEYQVLMNEQPAYNSIQLTFNNMSPMKLPQPNSWDDSCLSDISFADAYQDSISELSVEMTDHDFQEVVGCTKDNWHDIVVPTLDAIPEENRWAYCRNLDSIISANIESVSLPDNLDTFELQTAEAETMPGERRILINIIEQSYPENVNMDFAAMTERQLVMEAVKHDYEALAYASDELRNDRDVIRAAMEHYDSALKLASNDIKNDRNFNLEMVSNGYMHLTDVSEQLLNNTQFVNEVIKQATNDERRIQRYSTIYERTDGEAPVEGETILLVADSIIERGTDYLSFSLNVEHPVLQYATDLERTGKQEQWQVARDALEKNISLINTVEDAKALIASIKTGEIEAFELPADLLAECSSENTDYETALTHVQEASQAQKGQDRDR